MVCDFGGFMLLFVVVVGGIFEIVCWCLVADLWFVVCFAGVVVSFSVS